MLKKIFIFLFALLCFSHAWAGSIRIKSWKDSGEFAAPKGVFSSKLGMPVSGEFKTKGLFSSQAMGNSGEFKSDSGVFKTTGINVSHGDFTSSSGDFSSPSILSGTPQIMTNGGEFKSNSGEFHFSLPK